MKKLYLILNVGWDDATYGIAEFEPDELKAFLTLITNLNKNSIYKDQPRIYVHEISWDDLEESDDETDYKLHLYGKEYRTKGDVWDLVHDKRLCLIDD